MNPWVGTTVEVLTDIQGKAANKSLEKEEMLKSKSCPLNDDDQYKISKTNCTPTEPPGVSQRMWSVYLDLSISREYGTLGGHSSQASG
jgi:hypothetical protein